MPAWPTSTSSRSAASRRASSAAERADVFCAGAVTRASWPCFEDEVERRLRDPPEPREANALNDLADPRLACLGAEREPDLLRERGGRAKERREPVVGAANGVEIFLDSVACGRLDDHPRPV